jgi:branched-chain amino acid transport system substrate-binding protein
MTSWISIRLKYFLSLFLLFTVVTVKSQEAAPLVVGAVVSETGAHAGLAADYRKALLLWQDEVNAAGGLLGRRVELRLLDDASEAIKVGPLYQQLIRDKADALIGPYGTAATLMAAAEAESARRVLINGAGWSSAIHKRAPRFVFQSAMPYNAYGTGVLAVAKDEGYRSVFILGRDNPAAREMAAGALAEALKLGLSPGEVAVYGGGIEDFAPFVARARAVQADAWIAFGEVRDAAEMVKTFKRAGYAPRLFFARGATGAKFLSLVGQDAEFALAVVEYDARFATPANQKFVKAFAAKWSAPPGAAGAEGYAAASVLAEGLRRAGSANQDKLRAALADLSTSTVLGEFKVNPATGEQTATKPALVQILKGRSEVLWPRALETAKRVLPYPPWKERRLLKEAYSGQ